ncbi:MAG: lysozyme inhibitor LprI family protein [Luteimonas sp.]
MANGQASAEMNADAGTNPAAADRELNTVYQQVLLKHAMDKNFIRKLRAAQRAWLAYRDAELAARYPDPDPRTAYGCVYPDCAAGLKARLIHARISQLRMWLVGVAEGDVCAGSLPIVGDPD